MAGFWKHHRRTREIIPDLDGEFQVLNAIKSDTKISVFAFCQLAYNYSQPLADLDVNRKN